MSEDEPMLNQQQIAEHLGVGWSAVKKWRGHTIAALRKAGQVNSTSPTVALPRNALPVPDNQSEHVLDGAQPQWRPSTIERWIDRTDRRGYDGGFKPATPSGRPPDPDKPPRVRRRTPRGTPAVGKGRCNKHGSFTGLRCPGCSTARHAAA